MSFPRILKRVRDVINNAPDIELTDDLANHVAQLLVNTGMGATPEVILDTARVALQGGRVRQPMADGIPAINLEPIVEPLARVQAPTQPIDLTPNRLVREPTMPLDARDSVVDVVATPVTQSASSDDDGGYDLLFNEWLKTNFFATPATQASTPVPATVTQPFNVVEGQLGTGFNLQTTDINEWLKQFENEKWGKSGYPEEPIQTDSFDRFLPGYNSQPNSRHASLAHRRYLPPTENYDDRREQPLAWIGGLEIPVINDVPQRNSLLKDVLRDRIKNKAKATEILRNQENIFTPEAMSLPVNRVVSSDDNWGYDLLFPPELSSTTQASTPVSATVTQPLDVAALEKALEDNKDALTVPVIDTKIVGGGDSGTPAITVPVNPVATTGEKPSYPWGSERQIPSASPIASEPTVTQQVVTVPTTQATTKPILKGQGKTTAKYNSADNNPFAADYGYSVQQPTAKNTTTRTVPPPVLKGDKQSVTASTTPITVVDGGSGGSGSGGSGGIGGNDRQSGEFDFRGRGLKNAFLRGLRWSENARPVNVQEMLEGHDTHGIRPAFNKSAVWERAPESAYNDLEAVERYAFLGGRIWGDKIAHGTLHDLFDAFPPEAAWLAGYRHIYDDPKGIDVLHARPKAKEAEAAFSEARDLYAQMKLAKDSGDQSLAMELKRRADDMHDTAVALKDKAMRYRKEASMIGHLAGFGAAEALAIGSGNYNPLNLAEGGRAAGFQAITPNEEDPRKSNNPTLDLVTRNLMGQRGRLLPWEEFSRERPDVSLGDYQRYKDWYTGKAKDDLLGNVTLGLARFNPDGLSGAPEAQVLGYNMTIPGALASVGTVAGMGVLNRHLAKGMMR